VLAYDRERGRFHVFAAKTVVLATGGVGRAYKITSNSWEGTGDGHALAYRAGAELIDMEFVQFHPTGMVWPPSVKGILVTEGVRGEGGVLKNSEGRRFMFDDIPDNYKPQTASDADEGWRYTQGDKNARRPPELLTTRSRRALQSAGRSRPAAAARTTACFSTSRGSRTGSRTPRAHQAQAAEHVSPVQGAGGPRHHAASRWKWADDALHHGRHPGECRHAGVDDSRTVRRRRMRGGHQRRQSPRRQLPVGSDRVRQASRRVRGQACARSAGVGPERARHRRGDEDRARAVRPGRQRENPFTIQHDLQETMQDLVGIVRTDAEMREALTKLETLNARAARAGVDGHREFHTGWHAALDSATCSRSRKHYAIGARTARKPRRPFQRRLPRQVTGVRDVQHRGATARRHDGGRAAADP
jgi:succinate dehydrogenase / fumarate reductase flavoprotein subunit